MMSRDRNGSVFASGRLVARLLVIILTCALLASCGGNGDNNEPELPWSIEGDSDGEGVERVGIDRVDDEMIAIELTFTSAEAIPAEDPSGRLIDLAGTAVQDTDAEVRFAAAFPSAWLVERPETEDHMVEFDDPYLHSIRMPDGEAEELILLVADLYNSAEVTWTRDEESRTLTVTMVETESTFVPPS